MKRTDREVVVEALEAHSINRAAGKGYTNDRASANKHDIVIFKSQLLRFLEDLDEDMNVGEIIGILEDY